MVIGVVVSIEVGVKVDATPPTLSYAPVNVVLLAIPSAAFRVSFNFIFELVKFDSFIFYIISINY